MSRLLALIDDHKDRNGRPSDASVARAIGISPKTVSAWRNRGVRELPEPETLRKLGAFFNLSDEDIYYMAGVDAGYIVEVVEAEVTKVADDQAG